MDTFRIDFTVNDIEPNEIFIDMKETVLRKVCNVVNSCTNIFHLKCARNYIDQYYKIHGNQNKWIVESHYNNKIKDLK